MLASNERPCTSYRTMGTVPGLHWYVFRMLQDW